MSFFDWLKDNDTNKVDRPKPYKVIIPESDIVEWSLIWSSFEISNDAYSDCYSYSQEFKTSDDEQWFDLKLFSEDDFRKSELSSQPCSPYVKLLRLDYLDRNKAIKDAIEKVEYLNKNFRYSLLSTTSILDREGFYSRELMNSIKTKYVITGRLVSELNDNDLAKANDLRVMYNKLLKKARYIATNKNILSGYNEFNPVVMNCGIKLFLKCPSALYDRNLNKIDSLSLEDYNIMLNASDTTYETIEKLVDCNKELDRLYHNDIRLKQEAQKAFGVKIGK